MSKQAFHKLFYELSGPYDMSTEALVRIADSLTEFRCMIDLSVYDLRLGRIIRLDKDGRRRTFVEPVYYLYKKGDSKQLPTRFLRLGMVEKIIEYLDTGAMDVDEALDYGLEAETPDDEIEDQTGEDTAPDVGDDQSAGSQAGEDQGQGTGDQP